MGDRANILVKSENDPGVYLYTHWDGWTLPATLQIALRNKDRWSDHQYLTRIIFCQMIEGHEKDTLGYGISSVVGDGADRILVVDIEKSQVSYHNKVWSFDQYIALPPDEIDRIWVK